MDDFLDLFKNFENYEDFKIRKEMEENDPDQIR